MHAWSSWHVWLLRPCTPQPWGLNCVWIVTRRDVSKLREDMPISIIFANSKVPKLDMRSMHITRIYKEASTLWWERVNVKFTHFWIKMTVVSSSRSEAAWEKSFPKELRSATLLLSANDTTSNSSSQSTSAQSSSSTASPKSATSLKSLNPNPWCCVCVGVGAGARGGDLEVEIGGVCYSHEGVQESCCRGRSRRIGGNNPGSGSNLGLQLRQFLGPAEVEPLLSKITSNKPIIECKQAKCVLLSDLLRFLQCSSNKIIRCLCISTQKHAPSPCCVGAQPWKT